MTNWTTIIIWAVLYTIFLAIWYLRSRANKKRIQRRRERFQNLPKKDLRPISHTSEGWRRLGTVTHIHKDPDDGIEVHWKKD